MPTTTTIDTLTELLSHLIRMPSITSEPGTNRAALDWVEEQLSHLPLTIRRHDNAGHPCLIATTPAVKDPKKPKIWLAGHIDVVPGTTADFQPVIKDGRIYGRGAYDMKYGIAVFVALLQELGDDLADYDLGLMLTSDEEVGGYAGCGWLAKLGYTSEVMLLPECGNPWDLESGAKGISWWKLASTGKASHGARPWQGVNAIDQLVDYITELRSHLPQEPCHTDHHQHHTLNVGTITGGRATNQIADYAEATVDVRYLPDTPPEQVEAWFSAAAAKFPGISVIQLVAGEGFMTQQGGAVELYKCLVKNVTGHTVTSTLAHASSDARFFGAHGVQVITMPPDGGGQHSSGEWVGLEGLEHYYEITRQFVKEIAAPRQG